MVDIRKECTTAKTISPLQKKYNGQKTHDRTLKNKPYIYYIIFSYEHKSGAQKKSEKKIKKRGKVLANYLFLVLKKVTEEGGGQSK